MTETQMEHRRSYSFVGNTEVLIESYVVGQLYAAVVHCDENDGCVARAIGSTRGEAEQSALEQAELSMEMRRIGARVRSTLQTLADD